MDPATPHRHALGAALAGALAFAIAAALAPFGCSSSSSSPPPPGQYGTSCSPTGGEKGNTSCDVADGFECYGTSPTDASAFCTRYDCKDDGACPAGWWCSQVNAAPNVTTDVPSVGRDMTHSVCLPRDYCSPCKADRDCPLSVDGTQQHCATDAQGANGYCAPECGTDANCSLDATCQDWESVCLPAAGSSCHNDDDCGRSSNGIIQHCEGGHCTPECGSDADCGGSGGGAEGGAPSCQWRRLCRPRAGTCVGDGGFCSPCRSDADCTNGFCLSGAPYSKERFCSSKSTVPICDTMDTNPTGCPAPTMNDNWVAVACVAPPGASQDAATGSADQCEGLVVLGTSTGQPIAIPGCWTVNR